MHRNVTLFNHLVGEGTAEDRLDVVTIWIEHKCSVVIRPAQTGRSVFGSATVLIGTKRNGRPIIC
jgi:hypothetical protein